MNLMDWKFCMKKFIRSVEIDNERIFSIVEQSDDRLSMINGIKVTENNVSFIIEGYYEAIKELLVAYLLKNGMRSSNHQCLISYFYKQNTDNETEANLISQMSYFRNRLNYYGERIPLEFYKKNINDIEDVIKLIRKLLS